MLFSRCLSSASTPTIVIEDAAFQTPPETETETETEQPSEVAVGVGVLPRLSLLGRVIRRGRIELYTNQYLHQGLMLGLLIYGAFFAFTSSALAAGPDASQATGVLQNLYTQLRQFLFGVVGLGCGLVVTICSVLIFTGVFKPQNKEAAWSKLKLVAIAVVLLGWGPTLLNWGIDLMNSANPQGTPQITKVGN